MERRGLFSYSILPLGGDQYALASLLWSSYVIHLYLQSMTPLFQVFHQQIYKLKLHLKLFFPQRWFHLSERGNIMLMFVQVFIWFLF